jgi:hypothetical protein
MKTGIISIIALASLAACTAPTSSSQEALGETEQASSTGGITASISTSLSGSNYTSTVTVKNEGTAPAYNWQVDLNLNQSTMAQNNNGLSGASAYVIGSTEVFTPNTSASVLNAGAQVTFSFQGVKTGSNYAPTIATVDGVANGTAGSIADKIDHTSRAAATAALEVALAYETNKVKDTSPADPMYSSYDGLIWSPQSYIVSTCSGCSSYGSQITFDPNVPGYNFIPNQAKAELAFAQMDPSVASYLVAGLTSCFIDTASQYVYNFNAAPLAGYTFSTKAVSKNISEDAWGDPGVDNFTILGGTANGSETISLTESQVSGKDMAFGLLTTTSFWDFSNTTAAANKFHGGANACSPFNGPGGALANPYLVMSLNGSSLGARQVVSPAECQNLGCTSSLVVDPVAYATPGAYYDTAGVVGPQPNPFTLDPSSLYGTPDHSTQYAINPYAQYGTFTTPVTMMGQTKYKFNLCGSPGAGC